MSSAEHQAESGSLDLALLRAYAESSTERTPGRWEQGHGWVFTRPVYADSEALSNIFGQRYYDAERQEAEAVRAQRNVEYVAAVQPRVLLALLDRLEQAEAIAARVERIHTPVEASRSDRSLICDGCDEPWPCETARATGIKESTDA